MKIIELDALPNGAHRNQTAELSVLPKGWAKIPDNMDLSNFPFGDVTAEEVDGVMTVVNWVPGVIPEPEREREQEPDPQEDTDAMLIDHEYRLTLLELGVTE